MASFSSTYLLQSTTTRIRQVSSNIIDWQELHHRTDRFLHELHLIRQREVEQGFFSQNQATLFTVHLIIGSEHEDMAIVSDYTEHNTAFVYCAQSMIVNFVKNHYPLVKKINYLRWVFCTKLSFIPFSEDELVICLSQQQIKRYSRLINQWFF